MKKREIKIPKRFKLYAQTIEVIFNEKECTREDALGLSYNDENRIYLSELSGRANQLPDEKIEQTFHHELVHQIFDKAGYRELSKDEKLVSVFSNLLHQALNTFEY